MPFFHNLPRKHSEHNEEAKLSLLKPEKSHLKDFGVVVKEIISETEYDLETISLKS